jgi:hypothetical protein
MVIFGLSMGFLGAHYLNKNDKYDEKARSVHEIEEYILKLKK